ncbi:MAG: chain-length determining protein [Rhodobacterales bacterium]|nr:MAG: chain-length determining protein [Rhodobacterales bacterium]
MQLPHATAQHSAPATQVTTSSPSDDVIDLGNLFATIWRGKIWIALTTALAILVGGYIAYVATTPLYRSTAVVILETDQQQLLDLQSVVGGLSGDTSEVNSEVEVLRARALMGKVVERLELVNDPEFNAALHAPSRIDEWKARIRLWLGRTTAETEMTEAEQASRTQDSVITSLLEAVTVRNVPQSLVFQVTAETTSATKSALIADTIVEQYILDQIEVKFRATENATSWLSSRLTELQLNLEEAEAKVSNFSASTELVSAESLQGLERQIKELRDRISLAETGRDEIAVQIAAINAAETRADRVALADDAQLNNLWARADGDERFKEAFDNRLAVVMARLNANLDRTNQQLTALKASETDLARALDMQGQDLITLKQYTREAEAARVLYEYFLARFNETSAQQGIQQADSRILSNAVVPSVPSKPRKSLILAMSGLLGLLIGVGLILLRELRATGFRTAPDLEQATGYSVLGQIPQMPVRSRPKAIEYLTTKPMSAAAEAYRNLRTSLMLSHIDSPPKVIVMTSSLPGEGKTTNSIALAHNFCGLDKKVLLVEGDIRRRTLNQYFGDMPKHGVVSVMSGETSLAEAVFKSKGLGADILAGEATNTNAADLFASETFKAFIAKARESYDIVIVDCPPVLVVPDALIIAEQADATIFTVHWDTTTMHQVAESVRQFRMSGQKITGMVLSQISASGMKRYGYGGRYGAYAAYGSKYYVA